MLRTTVLDSKFVTFGASNTFMTPLSSKIKKNTLWSCSFKNKSFFLKTVGTRGIWRQCLSKISFYIWICFLQFTECRVYSAPFWIMDKKISEKTQGTLSPPTFATWHPHLEVAILGSPGFPSTINFIEVANGRILSQLESPVAVTNSPGLREVPFMNQVSWFAKIWALHF